MHQWIFKPNMAGAVLALGLLCHGSALAAGKAAEPDTPRRDPFTTSELMQAEVGRLSDGSASGRGFIASPGIGQTPKMKLKGFINNKQALAVLEIVGVGTYPVRKGDEIDLRIYGFNSVIKIVDVDGLSVRVKTGTINQELVVR